MVTLSSSTSLIAELSEQGSVQLLGAAPLTNREYSRRLEEDDNMSMRDNLRRFENLNVKNATLQTSQIGRVQEVRCNDTFALILTENLKVYLFGEAVAGQWDGGREKGESGMNRSNQNSSSFGSETNRGDGRPEEHLLEIPFPGTVTSMAVHSHHAAVVCDGNVYTWGSNALGALGRKTSPERQTPPLAHVGGRENGLADRRMSNDGQKKKKKELQKSDEHVSVHFYYYYPPEPVMFIKEQVASVSCGTGHTVAVTKGGLLYGWGLNSNGQVMAYPSEQAVQHPLLLSTLFSLQECLLVACGDDHTLALSRDGKLFSWGNNSHGQLGRKEIVSDGWRPLNPMKEKEKEKAKSDLSPFPKSKEKEKEKTMNGTSAAIISDSSSTTGDSKMNGEISSTSTSTPSSSSSSSTTNGRDGGVNGRSVLSSHDREEKDSLLSPQWCADILQKAALKKGSLRVHFPYQEIGKLGHHVIVDISACCNRSACVDVYGQVFCWGELFGMGFVSHRRVPRIMEAIHEEGKVFAFQVALGKTHLSYLRDIHATDCLHWLEGLAGPHTLGKALEYRVNSDVLMALANVEPTLLEVLQR